MAGIRLVTPNPVQIPPTGVKPSESSESATTGTLCMCGCGQELTPRDKRQRYLPGHRFKGYKTHRCPDCGSVHRKGVSK